MNNYLIKITNFKNRPGMYIPEENFSSGVAFIQGFDIAKNGELLKGFREWLIVRNKGGNNQTWDSLIFDLITKKLKANRKVEKLNDHEFLFNELLSWLIVFLNFKDKYGVNKIFVEYNEFTKQQNKLI